MRNPDTPVGLGGGIIVFGASWNGTGTYNVTGNTILRNRQGGAIHMNKGSGTATMSGTVAGNVIGTTGVNRSGSIEAFGIIIGARGAGGTHTTLVEDNQVFGWNDRAIVVADRRGQFDAQCHRPGNTADTFDPDQRPPRAPRRPRHPRCRCRIGLSRHRRRDRGRPQPPHGRRERGRGRR